MTKPFKIFIGVLAFLIAVPALFFATAWLTNQVAVAKIRSVANDLPVFNGTSVAEGKPGARDCYAVEGSYSCTAVTLKQRLDDEAGWQKMSDFIEASKKQGIAWPDGSTNRPYFAYSDVFERNGSKYQIYLDHSGGEFWAAVVRY